MYGKHSTPGGSCGYLVILKGLVAWGKEEASDNNLKKFLDNIHHGAKK